MANTDPSTENTDPKPLTPNPTAKIVELETVEDLAVRLGSADWAFAAAQTKHRWPVGQQLTEAAYLEAVDAALNEEIR